DKSAAAEIFTFASPKRLERLRPAEGNKSVIGGGRFLSSQLAQAGNRGAMPHHGVVADLSVAAGRMKVGEVNQVGKAVRRNTGDMPEEIEVEHAFEPSQAGQTFVGERAVDKQSRGFAYLLVHGRVDFFSWGRLE